MMKIIHICLCGPVTDGWSYQDNLLPKFHKKAGLDVTVIASLWVWNESGEMVKTSKQEYVNQDGVHIVRLKTKNDRPVFYRFKRYLGLYEVIEKICPDILFVHGVQFLDITLIIKYAKSHPNVKIYADNHADFSNSASNWVSKNILHKIIWRHYAKKIEPYTTKFYGVLPARVDFLKNVYGLPEEKCELLVMGADDDEVKKAKKPEVRAEKRKEYGLTDSDFVIMTGGKIDHNKRESLQLMDAVNASDNKNIKLLIFGSVVPELSEEFESRLSEKVRYIGWKKSEDIYSEFAAADLIAFPGLHSVLWEQAVGMGKPCLFRKIHGFEHVDIGGNCRFIENTSADSIKSDIENCIANTDEMKKAAEKGAEVFSYYNIAKRSLESE